VVPASLRAQGTGTFRHVAVAVDLTAVSEAAVERALDVASDGTHRVTLLHAVPGLARGLLTSRSDTTRLIDSLQLLFAARAAVDEEVVFPHADERLTRREHREALASAQLRAAVIDALMSRAATIEGVAARNAWCALVTAEAQALFAEERKLRAAFAPRDLGVLHRNANGVRAAVAEAFK